MTVTFPDSSNPGTVALDKMMSPGHGRVNKDRDSDCACVSPWVTWSSNSRNAADQPKLAPFPRETDHSNQVDGKRIEALWIPRPGCDQLCDRIFNRDPIKRSASCSSLELSP